MNEHPIDPRPGLSHELPGWSLAWARLAWDGTRAEVVAAMLAGEERRARQMWAVEALAGDPVVAAVRRLFRAAGCDPTRYRPSSEALLRRVLKGEALPNVHPLVDCNNALSIALAVPSCVMVAGSLRPPLTLRAGRDGESMVSLRGPFALAGKPLLADQEGPFGTPITDSEKVKVLPETRLAWLVAYLPADELGADVVARTLTRLTSGGPIRVG